MKNFRQYTEEMNPPNQDTEDKNLKSKEKKQAQIKKMVLLKKMQAVRAGAGADIVASHEPEGEMVEGSLHKWFSGSKSKDGKPGWVQSDGSPCANEPGETKTPKCYSSAKRASMSKKELRSADARKARKDPNQQQKSGAAKPTYVATDKKKMKEQNEVDECWKTHKKVGMKKKGGKMVPDCRPKNEEVVLETKDKKGKGSGTKDACYHKVKARFKVWPSAYGSGALVKCRKAGAANWGNSKKEEVEYATEAKVDAGKSPEQKEKDRNVRKFGVSHNVAGHGKLRRALHRSDRGDKKIKGDKSQYVEMESVEKKKKNCGCGKDPCITYGKQEKVEEGAAWTKKSGKNKEGGLNEKGRKSYEKANPGSDLKAPTKKVGNPRRKSFCARMGGMKKKLTSSKTANDPDSRINKALRKWNCSYEPDGTPIMEDKAFNTVLAALQKKHGKDNIITKKNPMKPQSAADKAKARAHQAKVDKENAAARAKDPSQGRYPKG